MAPNMNSTVADNETGETDVCDHETGEFFPRRLERCDSTDAETGEPQAAAKKSTFQVPKRLYGEHKKRRNHQLINDLVKPGTSKTKSKCCINENIFYASQNKRPMLFILPTLLLLPAWATALCSILEICLHMWAHKRNKMCGDKMVVMKSPLHMITSEFCALCRSDMYMDKIGKLQDERKLQVETRKLRVYMEKVSSIVT